MDILLDTCTFLWLATDPSALSKRAIKMYSDMENNLYLSSVSIWEIIVKQSIGKLSIDEPVNEFVEFECEENSIEVVSLTDRDVFQLSSLADNHKDPFDRMLVCQAKENDFTILTPDKQISRYLVPTIW